MQLTDEAGRAYVELGALVASMPNLRSVDPSSNIPEVTLVWLAELEAIISMMKGVGISEMELKLATQRLIDTKGGSNSATAIRLIALRCLAIARAQSPVSARSAFVPTGADFDAFSAMNGIFKSAASSILVVDPYLDATVLTKFAPLVNEGVSIALLTDQSGIRRDLLPAVEAWISQYGNSRKLALRAAMPRTLHDRAILIDRTEAWILTQSLKDFAARWPAIVQKTDADLALMKFDAYSDIWNQALAMAG
jgi:hypothetical protein